MSGNLRSSAQKSIGRFGTGTELSWVRSVLAPKCQCPVKWLNADWSAVRKTHMFQQNGGKTAKWWVKISNFRLLHFSFLHFTKNISDFYNLHLAYLNLAFSLLITLNLTRNHKLIQKPELAEKTSRRATLFNNGLPPPSQIPHALCNDTFNPCGCKFVWFKMEKGLRYRF